MYTIKEDTMSIAMFVLSAMAVIVIGVVCFVYEAPEIATSVLRNVDRHRSGLVRKEIDLSNGLHYVYLEGGKGEPLVLLHGFGGNKDNFSKVARFLTPHYRVIIPDHIGFGESSHPQEVDYAPPAQVERLQAFAHALGIDHLHLGGSSMGGQIAMTYAALYPAKVVSLWLLDPGGVWSAPKSELFKIITETGRSPLMVKNEDEFVQFIKFLWSKPPFIPRPILNVMAQERIRNYDLMKRIGKQIISDSVEKRVNGLLTPALIVWGDKDRVLNFASAEILNNLMPHSHVIIMPDIGHVPMMEKPQQSAEDYLRFRVSL